eukprot:GHVP01029076.1.p1 GENE.GHVP01029076.1~~GHVP01029076.1.p1  ORF type:complete len:206 (-),score=29.00 GHVP01029076.1:176-793(-)
MFTLIESLIHTYGKKVLRKILIIGPPLSGKSTVIRGIQTYLDSTQVIGNEDFVSIGLRQANYESENMILKFLDCIGTFDDQLSLWKELTLNVDAIILVTRKFSTENLKFSAQFGRFLDYLFKLELPIVLAVNCETEAERFFDVENLLLFLEEKIGFRFSQDSTIIANLKSQENVKRLLQVITLVLQNSHSVQNNQRVLHRKELFD